jgi:hypothetical protein
MPKHFCIACLSDPHLKAHLGDPDPEVNCDCCGLAGALELSDLIEILQQAIEVDYRDPAHQVPYESSEGGYQASLLSGSDLVYEMDAWTENDQLVGDAAQELAGTDWVQRDFFPLSQFDRFAYGWDAFVEAILTQTRYLFFLPPMDGEDARGDTIHPSGMLAELGRLLEQFGLYATIKAGTPLYRIRIVPDSETAFDAASLGSPPSDMARANRMSPAGISMFYCGLDPETAIEETLDRNRTEGKQVCIATFLPARTLDVLDLTELPDPPSHFDFDRAYLRPAIQFLRSFASDLAKSVERDGNEHTAYVPTQVVTEYVRYRHAPYGSQIDGILYQSSRPGATKALVIFAGPDDCGDMKEGTASGSLLNLTGFQLKHPADLPGPNHQAG